MSPRDHMPYNMDEKVREVLSVQRETKEDVSEIKGVVLRIDAEHRKTASTVDRHSWIWKMIGAVAGTFGVVAVTSVVWLYTTTLRLEERVADQAQEIASIRERYDADASELSVTLNAVREGLVELRTEARSTGARLERLERAVSDRRNR